MIRKNSRIGIIGAGLGGISAAALLQQAGFDVKVYEQTQVLTRLGAGIHLSPNVMRVLRRVGIEPQLRAAGVQPETFISRTFDTGDLMVSLQLGNVAEKKYGAPYLTVHRGDFHAELVTAVAPGTIEFGRRLIGLHQDGPRMHLDFDGGTSEECDIVIGADGVNSKVREVLLGPEDPIYTGYVAHRAIFPTGRLNGMKVDDCTKWWSPDRHFIVYFITSDRDEIYFVTGVPEPTWPHKESFVPCSIDEFEQAFHGFHPQVIEMIRACPEATKWPLLEREPLPLWSRGRIVLLGDACHPMKPHMAQGAGMAIEDAAMLTRCLAESPTDHELAFRLYEANRKDRTSKVQFYSHENNWLRDNADVDWVFDYDVFNERLVAPKAA